MNRSCCRCVSSAAVLLLLAGTALCQQAGAVPSGSNRSVVAPAGSEPVPHWIAAPQGSMRDVQWMRSLQADGAVESATLKVAVHFCDVALRINGKPVLTVEPTRHMLTLDVTDWMRRGENQIAIKHQSRDSNVAALALSLEVRIADATGSRRVFVVSDAQWRMSGMPSVAASDAAAKPNPTPATSGIVDLGEVRAEMWGIGRRDISLSSIDNYEQWQQAKGEAGAKRPSRFWTVPGFEVTELKAADAKEGSWVSMAFDEQGRLTIGREDSGFLRLTLSGDQQTVSKTEAISSELLECRGLLYRDGWLYANANNSQGLYRLRLSDEGTATSQTLVRTFPGKFGHGRNDLAFGPAARVRLTSENAHQEPLPFLYSIHGDAVDLPTENITDQTSPLRETRRGKVLREGTLVRTDLEGRNWELVCAGLRNPYGVAAHSSGDVFTFDADNEYDMGTPWYRPTRVLHLMTGGDAGYRDVTGTMPPRFHDQPDHVPPLLDIGRSSPTAIMFGTGLKFPLPYREALFILDWTYGRVIAVHLEPYGAGWRAASELFLQGRPLNVTDVAAGPDGAMYLITGGRKTQSALYRIRWTGPEPSTKADPAAGDSFAARCERFAERSRAVRLELEAGRSPSLSEIMAKLADADAAIRHAARLALERQSVDEWRGGVLSAQPGPAALQALMCLARARVPGDVAAIAQRLREYKLAELDLTSQFVWLRIASLAVETNPDEMRSRYGSLVPLVASVWPAASPGTLRVTEEGSTDELRRRLALLLASFNADELPRLVARDLLSSPAQEDRLAGLLALHRHRVGWTMELRRSQFAALNQVPQMLGGQGMPAIEKWLRDQTLQTLTPEERLALKSVLQPVAVALEPLPPPRPVVRQWTLKDFGDLKPEARGSGNAARGQTIFRDALCIRCHRSGRSGAAVGPDLTSVAGRFSRADILRSILTPSDSVAENYRMEVVITESGQTYTGRILSEGDYRSEKLRLSTDALRPDQVVEIDKKDIAEHRQSPLSPMPQGLLDSFTRSDILDLLAFLESGGRGL